MKFWRKRRTVGCELPYGVFWTSARTMCAVVTACKAAQDNWVILNNLELAAQQKMFDDLFDLPLFPGSQASSEDEKENEASSEDEEEDEEPMVTPLSVSFSFSLSLSLFLRDLVSIYCLSLCLSTSLPLFFSLYSSVSLSLCLSLSLFLSSLSLSLSSFPALISIHFSYPPPSPPSTDACH